MSYKTEQEAFWKGDFGDAYVDRNQGAQVEASNLALFSRAFRATYGLKTILELGSNIGMNLRALQKLYPAVDLTAVEINEKAAGELERALPEVEVHRSSILEFEPAKTWDLVFTKGVVRRAKRGASYSVKVRLL